MTQTTALIDGDIVVFRCAVVFDKPQAQLKRPGHYKFDIAHAKMNAMKQITEICNSVDAKRGIVCFTGPNNFRKDVLPTYKHNRAEKRKPILFNELKEWLDGEVETMERPVLEADDLMGILATSDAPNLGLTRRVICSIDKDLRTIPGLHWNWDKQDVFLDDVETITEEAADRTFYRQVIIGDSTDGYTGCPGAGPVAAEKAIHDKMVDTSEMWSAVVATYEKAGFEEKDAIIQAQCARILRGCDYDFDKGEPILWTP
jgi:DNA polymerase-1